jgi:thioredoxin reductase (NADPH)
MEKRELIIIGGGPAGLAAGIYAARANLDVVLIERGVPGGTAATAYLVENYPGFADGISGPELMAQMEKQARHFGVKFIIDQVQSLTWANGIFMVNTSSEEIKAQAVILATGTQPKLLKVKGEHDFHGRGVSYCATCDGAFFRDKHIAVVGGSDAAVEEALFLTNFAAKVYLIHKREELQAATINLLRARENPKIEFILNHTVKEIHGDEVVTGIKIKDVRTGESRHLEVAGVFVYGGTRPNSELVKDLATLNEQGYVVTDEEMGTKCPGLFAAGDVRKKNLRQIVTAVADGAIAATAAKKYHQEIERKNKIKK